MGASGLGGGLGCLEDLRVSGGVPELFMGDLGEGVAAVDGDTVIADLVPLVASGEFRDTTGFEDAGCLSDDFRVGRPAAMV